jgi:hypothetical protein
MNGIFTSKFTVIFYAQAKKTLAAAKTWEKTKVQFLVRHKSGRLRPSVPKWQGLDGGLTLKRRTRKYYREVLASQGNRIKKRGHPERSAARAKAGRHGVEGSRESSEDHQTRPNIFPAFHGILRLRDARHLRPPGIAPPQNDPVFLMRLPWLASLLKSWPRLGGTELRRITPSALKSWAVQYGQTFSATRHKGTISLLRHIFQTAVEDEQRSRTQIVEPRVHRADVGFINEQPVGDEEAREGRPRIDAVPALAADALHVVAVENLEGETEAVLQFVAPLEKHRGRAGRDDFLNATAQQEFGRDETGLDGLAEADIVRDEEVHARQPRRLVERFQLIRIDADASSERGLEESAVRRSHAVPPDRIQERREVPRLVESFVPDAFPCLLTGDEPVEFRLPHDLDFLALGIIVRASERNDIAVGTRIHHLHKPVTRANTDDIALGWNCVWKCSDDMRLDC